jgi:hypothetical protein
MADKPVEKQKKKRGNLANLRMFQKGQSGNPKGRPRKDVCLTSLVKEELEKIAKNPDGSPMKDANGKVVKMTYYDLLARAIVRGAIKGKTVALKELWDRIDGRVPLPISNPDGSPVTHFSDEQIDKMIAAYKLTRKEEDE